MVGRRFVRFGMLFLISTLVFFIGMPSWAAGLEAQIDRSAINHGESFTLNLTLSDAKALGSPDLSVLDRDFQILSKGQSSNISIINGSYSAAVTWRLVLMPKRAGTLQVPVMSIKTQQGVLTSKSLDVVVSQQTSSSDKAPKDRDVYVTEEASTLSPYINAPVVYTVRLYASKPVSDIAHGDLKIDDAIVEKQGEAKIYDAVKEGKQFKVVELRFLITPLKAGDMKIPAFVFQGMIRGNGGRNGGASPFGSQFGGGGNNPFNVFEDLGIFSDLMGQPFTLMTDEIKINVKDAAEPMDTWLPLEGLEISDTLDGQEGAKIGEPLTRKLTMVGKGNVGTVLPSFEGQVASGQDFSVYADQPETGMNVSDDGQSIIGWKDEVFTLVPKHGGALTLPEIRIPWWDVKSHKIAYAVVPARTVQVAGTPLTPQAEGATNTTPKKTNQVEAQGAGDVLPSASEGQTLLNSNSGMQLEVGLAALIIGVGALLLIRNRRKSKAKPQAGEAQKVKGQGLNPKPANQNAEVEVKRIVASDLNKAGDLDTLKAMLMAFARQNAGSAAALSLKDVTQVFAKGLDEDKAAALGKIVSKLEGALYAGQDVSLEGLRADLVDILERYRPPKNRGEGKKTRLGALNPS